MNESLPSPPRAARDRLLLAAEIAAFAAIFAFEDFLPLSKTPFFLAVGAASLRLRGVAWRSLGLARPPSWARALAIGIGAGVAFWALEFFVIQEGLAALLGAYPDLSAFAPLVGNLRLLAILLGANFVLAAVGEELVWRGFALGRIAGALGGSQAAWWAAVGIVNVAFGLAHAYQGLTGVIEAGVDGALLAALYLGCGRNLVAPMAAHFVSNAIDFVWIYAGRYPGL